MLESAVVTEQPSAAFRVPIGTASLLFMDIPDTQINVPFA